MDKYLRACALERLASCQSGRRLWDNLSLVSLGNFALLFSVTRAVSLVDSDRIAIVGMDHGLGFLSNNESTTDRLPNNCSRGKANWKVSRFQLNQIDDRLYTVTLKAHEGIRKQRTCIHSGSATWGSVPLDAQ
jgi:hypothetical protein